MANNKRAQLLAQQRAAAKARRNRLTIVIAAVVVVALVLVGVVMWQTRPDQPVAPPDSNTSAATLPAPAPSSIAPSTTTTGMYIPPDGTAEMGYIQVKAANVSPDALTVDEHLDYQCPYCHLADEVVGPSFRALAERGDIILRVHIRSFLDTSLKNDSSTRAAMASTCADTVGSFMAYHETIFANQPDKEGTGYTDQQLRVDFPAQAGITGSDLTQFQTCYDTKQTLAYVEQMEEVNGTSRTINYTEQDPPGGTPAFYVNGTVLSLSQMVGFDSKNNAVAKVDTSPDGFLAFLKTIPA